MISKFCFTKLFMPFIVLQTIKVKLLSENSLWRNILIHLKTKVTPRNPLFLHFVQCGPEDVRVLITLINLKFLVSRRSKVLQWKKSNEKSWRNSRRSKVLPATKYFLHFRAAIMDFLITFNCLVFSCNKFVGYVLQIKMQLQKP